jgi:YVTN family beta-propeller protein
VIRGGLLLALTFAKGNPGNNPYNGIGTAKSPNPGILPSSLSPTYAYVADFSSGTVSVIRTSDNTVVATVAVGSGPYGIAITPDGNYAYVVNSTFAGTSGTVSVIQISNNTVVATITVGNSPVAIAITPDGNYAYVTNTGDRTVSVIRTSDNIVVATVAVS